MNLIQRRALSYSSCWLSIISIITNNKLQYSSLDEYPQIILFATLIYLLITFISYLYFRSIYKYSESIEIETIEEYISKNNIKKSKYITILRPFGYDGDCYFVDSHMLITNTTLEEKIYRIALNKYSHNTVVVVSPKGQEISPGPTYLKAGIEWQINVSSLIENSSCIIFIIPNRKSITPSIEWEIDEVIRKKVNFAFIFPTNKTMNKIHALYLTSRLAQRIDYDIGDLTKDRSLKNIRIYALEYVNGKVYYISTGEKFLDRFRISHVGLFYDRIFRDFLSNLI